jgi:hypothetical protein
MVRAASNVCGRKDEQGEHGLPISGERIAPFPHNSSSADRMELNERGRLSRKFEYIETQLGIASTHSKPQH